MLFSHDCDKDRESREGGATRACDGLSHGGQGGLRGGKGISDDPWTMNGC